MKKTINQRKLTLNTETIRILKDNDARRVVGGIPSAGSCVQLCLTVTCGNTTSPTTHSQADTACTIGSITCPPSLVKRCAG
jgi:hypothetical protein